LNYVIVYFVVFRP